MEVTVQYMGQLEHCSRTDCETLLVRDGIAITALLEDLARKYGEDFARILFVDGAVRPSVMILHNGTPVDKDALPALSNGDEITLLSAISGG